MRRSVDVLRSFKKYFGELVLPEYEVRLSSEEGTWERPFCRVAWTTPVTAIAWGARVQENRRTMQVVCWPRESETPDMARLDAEDVVERVFIALMQGVHEPSMRRDRGRAHPLRIPIYDYADKPVTYVATDADRDPQDFAWIPEQPNVGDIEDPNTDLSRLIIADFRVKWMRSVAVTGDFPTVQTVGVNPSPSP